MQRVFIVSVERRGQRDADSVCLWHCVPNTRPHAATDGSPNRCSKRVPDGGTHEQSDDRDSDQRAHDRDANQRPDSHAHARAIGGAHTRANHAESNGVPNVVSHTCLPRVRRGSNGLWGHGALAWLQRRDSPNVPSSLQRVHPGTVRTPDHATHGSANYVA